MEPEGVPPDPAVILGRMLSRHGVMQEGGFVARRQKAVGAAHGHPNGRGRFALELEGLRHSICGRGPAKVENHVQDAPRQARDSLVMGDRRRLEMHAPEDARMRPGDEALPQGQDAAPRREVGGVE